MGFFRSQFLKVVQWKDDSNNILVHRFDMQGKEIMKNSKITVNEGQNVVFMYKGQIADLFTPGYYSLETGNIPFLTALASWKYFFETPLKADAYFVNMRQFAGEKWGTTNPVIVRDKEFGVVRIRAFGTFSFKVNDPKVFIREITSTNSNYTKEAISEYLKSILLSGFADAVAESKIPLLDIAANTLELNEIVRNLVTEKYKKLGLELCGFNIENVSVPEEVEKSLDTKSSMGILRDDMGTFTQYQAAMGMREAANNPNGGLAGAGVGLGAGVAMGNVFAGAMQGINYQQPQAQTAPSAAVESNINCPKCNASNVKNAKFCSSCGEKMAEEIVFCASCGHKMAAKAKFCADCGERKE